MLFKYSLLYEKVKKMKIGARIIKTAIAVALCTILGRFLTDNSGFFAAIAAIITMQETFSTSFKKGKERVFGTTAGALIGYLFALISPDSILLISIGIVLTIYICNLLKWQGSIVIACVVFISIMTSHSVDPLPYSINRIIDTTAGIAIALAVNYLILLPKPILSAYKEWGNLFDELSQHIDEVIYENKNVDLEELHEKIMDLKKKAKLNQLDTIIHQENEKEIERLDELIEGLLSVYEHLKFVEEIKQADTELTYLSSLEDNPSSKKISDIILQFHSQRVFKEWSRIKSLRKKADRV